MNKKGFTLVELLAVVAILAILVILVMPNVLESFNTSKVNTFFTNAIKLVPQAQTDYLSDKMANVHQTDFTYRSDVPVNKLSITSTGGLNYCIVVDASSGLITHFEAGNADMWVEVTGSVADGGVTQEMVQAAKTDTTKFHNAGGFTVNCAAN